MLEQSSPFTADTDFVVRPKTISPTEPAAEASEQQDLRFINRELSWLRFNRRVLAEAMDPSLPLLERVRFISIFASNLDEFFMIRVSGLRAQMAAGAGERSPDGRSPAEQLAAIRRDLIPTLETVSACWTSDLLPRLADAGIRVLTYADLKKKQRKLLRHYFRDNIFPVLTPLAFDPGHPFPHISNLSLNLAVVIRDAQQREKFARLKVPLTFPRFVRIPDEERADTYEQLGLAAVTESNFVLLEDVISENLDLLFSRMEIVAAYPFRVTRDAELEIGADEAADLLTAVENVIERRHFGSVVRLQIGDEMPKRIREILTVNLELQPYQVYTMRGLLGLSDLAQIASLDRPDLKFPPFVPVARAFTKSPQGIFAAIVRRDLFLYHPYDSFEAVLDFLYTAARDPCVVAIKQTLYRVGPDSPVVECLKEARLNDKQVAALVELKARFDEENNIVWARELEEAGVHVVYGVMGLKTHAKMTLVVRRESTGIRLYVHVASGNYNRAAGRAYTDVGLLTCDPDIAKDVVDAFNALTGYSDKEDYDELVVAPGGMRRHIVSRIEREIERHRTKGDGYIAFKCNSLSDEHIISALYRASSEGVKVDLQIRGICCLRPKVAGLSEHITVTSVVGRFLEHARLYYFRNGGEDELLIGSADMMPRNLDRRVEVLVPVKDPVLRAAVRDSILFVSLRDNVKCWSLSPDGTYERREPAPTEDPVSSQDLFMSVGGSWRLED